MEKESKMKKNFDRQSEERELLKATLFSIMDGIIATDISGEIILMNPMAENYTGWYGKEAYGKDFELIFPAIDMTTREKIQSSVELFLEKRTPYQFPENTGLMSRGGQEFYIAGTTSGIYSQKGELRGIVVAFRDFTKEKSLEKDKRTYEEELKRLAIKDELTGLYNRNYFDAIIHESMEHSDRYQEPLSILLLDLDYFKKVNDTWGHPSGDELLKQTAQTIGKTIRDSDTLVRFGGEEFIVLMPQTSREGAATGAEKIRAAIEKNNHPIMGVQTVSIGVAQRMNAESFLHWYRRLDKALYQAKETGRNRVVLSDEMERLPVASVSLALRKEWESRNKEIDGQHKEMIEIANRLINMSYEGMEHLEIMDQLNELLSHTVSHFAYEEKIMFHMGYSDCLIHEEIHKNLVAKAVRLKESYEKGDIHASAFFSFVVDDVILGHLAEEDTKYFPYLENKIQ